MNRPNQYTTDVNDMPAPTWVAKGLFWNPEYLEWREERDGAETRRSAEEHELKLTSPREWNGSFRNLASAKERICVVESCRKPFIPNGPKQRTCGSEECKKARKAETTADWYVKSRKAGAA